MRRLWRWIVGLSVACSLLAVAYLLLSRPRPRPSRGGLQPPDRARCQVLRVVDGDTLRLRWVDDPNAGEIVARVLGIDCPESHWNNKCERDGKSGRRGCRWQVPCGQNATREAEDLLRGQQVILECGGHCRKGGYGRSLRYVRLPDGRDYGLEMIRLGLCEDFSFRYSHPRAEIYLQAQMLARGAHRGIWSR